MTRLETRRLGDSDMHITRVGIGTAPIGSASEWKVYWGPQNEQSAIRAIQAAIDLGVNWIDTAPFYGWGQAERIVGKAIRGRRDLVYVFTKCGTLDVAIAWTLMRPGLTGAIVGIRSEKEAAEMLGAVGWKLTEEDADWRE